MSDYFEVIKPATVKDLAKLCNYLVAHELGDAELTFNDGEFCIYLNSFGNICYDNYIGTTSGKKFVDIQP